LKNWEISDVKAKLIQEVTKSSTGLKTHVTIRIQIDGNIDEEQKQELTNQANSCYIHRQLMGEWNIDHAIEMTNFQLQSSNKI
jgi:putative redox protein